MMKNCPYCTSEIPDEALKCKYCGEWVTEQKGPADSMGRRQGFFGSGDLGTTLSEGVKLYAKYKIAALIIGLILFLIVLFGFVIPHLRRVQKGFEGFRAPRIETPR